MNAFINSFTAEWMKKRRSLASWLVIIGGFFVPFIILIIFLVYPKQLMNVHSSGHFWETLFMKGWQFMSFMLLPMGIVLAVSLITQLEFKNNTWKQLHVAPVSFANIYFSKLFVLLAMLLQLFILFNAGIYLSAVIPAIFKSSIPFPDYHINVGFFLWENTKYFIICLPMVAIQYVISLQFKNFLVPVGAGLVLVVGGLIALSWQYSYTLPPSYTALHFLQATGKATPAHNLLYWSFGYFIFFIAFGYYLYAFKKEKG